MKKAAQHIGLSVTKTAGFGLLLMCGASWLGQLPAFHMNMAAGSLAIAAGLLGLWQMMRSLRPVKDVPAALVVTTFLFAALANGSVIFSAATFLLGQFVPLQSLVASLAVFAFLGSKYVYWRKRGGTHSPDQRQRRVFSLLLLNFTFFLMLFCPNFPWVSICATVLVVVATWIERSLFLTDETDV
ncbi:MAG: hypothetical protein KGO94_09050 [Alphaproteobacteria bacterium]|nr:hypothetical protein [Alphaproteobacteria bacterium]